MPVGPIRAGTGPRKCPNLQRKSKSSRFAQELSGYAVSSNVLLQDAGFGLLEKFLTALFVEAVSLFEESAFLQGNGLGNFCPFSALMVSTSCSFPG
jgi:hypothetical protein